MGGYRAPVTQRPLYHSHAWAYDHVVPEPGGPEVDAVAAVLQGPRVLDAGCGTGRFAAALAARGFEVTGVDRSAELVAVARGRFAGVVFEVADLRDRVVGAPFDSVLCRGVLNDCIGDEDRAAVVSGLRRALRNRGLLVADVRDWEGSVRHYRERPVFEAHGAGVEFRSVTQLESERHVLRVSERITDGQGSEDYEFLMRCWTRPELEAALHAAGFGELDFSALPPRRADRLVVVAR